MRLMKLAAASIALVVSVRCGHDLLHTEPFGWWGLAFGFFLALGSVSAHYIGKPPEDRD